MEKFKFKREHIGQTFDTKILVNSDNSDNSPFFEFRIDTGGIKRMTKFVSYGVVNNDIVYFFYGRKIFNTILNFITDNPPTEFIGVEFKVTVVGVCIHKHILLDFEISDIKYMASTIRVVTTRTLSSIAEEESLNVNTFLPKKEKPKQYEGNTVKHKFI